MEGNTTYLPKGYMGKVLSIDLSEQTYSTGPLQPEIAQDFLGGRGLGIAFFISTFFSA